MSGHQPFSTLTVNFSYSRKAKIAAHTEQLKSKIALNEMRNPVSLTKNESAENDTSCD